MKDVLMLMQKGDGLGILRHDVMTVLEACTVGRNHQVRKIPCVRRPDRRVNKQKTEEIDREQTEMDSKQ